MPLRWKLIGLSVLILAAVIGGFSFFLVAGLARSLVAGMDAELATRAEGLVKVAEYNGADWYVERKSRIHEEFSEKSGLY